MVKFLIKIRITVNFTRSRARETLDEILIIYTSHTKFR